MSNLSTLPKGDSAWLLRKAIERIIQQISVLETNIGSSTTGNSANTQIIFNDNGVLRGDAGLTYNAATDLLSVGAATITGDLTVDTSTLKVDSANNYVGIGTASPVQSLTISGEASVRVGDLFYWNAYYNAGFKARAAGYAAYISEDGSGDFTIANTASSAAGAGSSLSFLTRHRITNAGVCTWENVGGVAGTAMTLNSTGLGVGTAPSFKIHANGVIGTTNTFGAFTALQTAGGTGYRWTLANDNNFYLQYSPDGFGSTATSRIALDSSGNVGVEVTPSAWATYKGLQVGYASLAGYAGSDTLLGSNVYFDGGAFRYISTATASSYRQLSGVHSWSTAPSGTAGNAITFTQAMTLDASGNLLVGKAALSDTTVGWYVRPNGITTATMSSSVNTDTSYQLYSTGASAYRFYVGMGGTVYATNTTISAISDARLKENVQDIDVGLDAILALKPRKFDWKTGKGKNIKGDRGFIAQEFETVFPNLIDEWKDPAPEGEAPYKSVRQDLIPVLVKAIQELTARVEALEA